MYENVFVDANVLLDYLDASRPTHQQSTEALRYLLQQNVTLFTSCDIMTTIYYVHAKKAKKEAFLDMKLINRFCTIIDFSNREIDNVCALMEKDSRYDDFEDALQYVLAKKSVCDLILTNDNAFVADEIETIGSIDFCSGLGL